MYHLVVAYLSIPDLVVMRALSTELRDAVAGAPQWEAALTLLNTTNHFNVDSDTGEDFIADLEPCIDGDDAFLALDPRRQGWYAKATSETRFRVLVVFCMDCVTFLRSPYDITQPMSAGYPFRAQAVVSHWLGLSPARALLHARYNATLDALQDAASCDATPTRFSVMHQLIELGIADQCLHSKHGVYSQYSASPLGIGPGWIGVADTSCASWRRMIYQPGRLSPVDNGTETAPGSDVHLAALAMPLLTSGNIDDERSRILFGGVLAEKLSVLGAAQIALPAIVKFLHAKDIDNSDDKYTTGNVIVAGT